MLDFLRHPNQRRTQLALAPGAADQHGRAHAAYGQRRFADATGQLAGAQPDDNRETRLNRRFDCAHHLNQEAGAVLDAAARE